MSRGAGGAGLTGCSPQLSMSSAIEGINRELKMKGTGHVLITVLKINIIVIKTKEEFKSAK